MAKAINKNKSNKESFQLRMLRNLTLGTDLSINRPAIQDGMFKHWWHTFKINYSTFVLQNLICLLFALPFIALVFFVFPNLEQRWLLEQSFNFVGDLGFGFSGATNDTISAIKGIYMFRLMFYSLIIPCFTLIGLGISGLFYSGRNAAWGAKIKFRHYFRGLKKYWWQYMLAFTVIGIVAYGVIASIYGYLYMQIAGMTTWYMWFVMIIACLIAVVVIFFMLTYLPIVTMYNFKSKDKIKNSILLGIVLMLKSAFIAIFLLAPPLALAWTTTTQLILLVSFILFGFAGYASALQCYGVFVADNYTTPLYQNRVEIEEKERRRAANESKKSYNKGNNNNYNRNKKNRGKR